MRGDCFTHPERVRGRAKVGKQDHRKWQQPVCLAPNEPSKANCPPGKPSAGHDDAKEEQGDLDPPTATGNRRISIGSFIDILHPTHANSADHNEGQRKKVGDAA